MLAGRVRLPPPSEGVGETSIPLHVPSALLWGSTGVEPESILCPLPAIGAWVPGAPAHFNNRITVDGGDLASRTGRMPRNCIADVGWSSFLRS